MSVFTDCLRGTEILAYGTNNSKARSVRLFLELVNVEHSMHTK